MKIQIESTDEIVCINGTEARIWRGVTEAGIECFCFIHRIAAKSEDDLAAFEQELLSRPSGGIAIEHKLNELSGRVTA